jgi:hypothetical protein
MVSVYLTLFEMSLDRNWQHLSPCVSRTLLLLGLDASINFLPRVNYRREARVSQHRLGKSLTIEVRRKSSVQFMYGKQATALIAAFTDVLPAGHYLCQKSDASSVLY